MEFIFDNTTTEFIKQFEGCVLHTYQDSRGIWTIGIGTTRYPSGVAVTGSDPDITIEQALEYLLYHLNQIVLPCLNNHIQVGLTQNQINSIASLVYNIGTQGFINSHVLTAINNGSDMNTLKTYWLRWCNAGGKPILLSRREKEFENYIS